MGGSSYDRPVYTSTGGSSYSDDSDTLYSKRHKVHQDVLMDGERRIFTDAKNPICIALDVTGSMGNSAKIMFDKMPMFWGQIEQKGYLPDPSVSFAAIGDAYCDTAPLQVTQFEKGKKIDEWLDKIWLEGGGGGQTMESYDLAALFYVQRCSVPNMEHGFFFFIGDEDYYKELDGKKTDPIFQELMFKFDTYFIHWPYNSYGGDDSRIVASWKKLMGERFLILDEPKAIVDIMLGIIAMRMGVRDMNEYEDDLKNKGQSASRIKKVRETIKKYERKKNSKDIVVIPSNKDIASYRPLLPNRDPFRKRIAR